MERAATRGASLSMISVYIRVSTSQDIIKVMFDYHLEHFSGPAACAADLAAGAPQGILRDVSLTWIATIVPQE